MGFCCQWWPCLCAGCGEGLSVGGGEDGVAIGAMVSPWGWWGAGCALGGDGRVVLCALLCMKAGDRHFIFLY